MKLQLLTLALFFQCGSVSALAQSSPSSTRIEFEDLPKLVRDKNEKVKASDIAVSAAKARTGYLGRSFLPSLNVKGGTESATLGTASAEQRDFWGAEASLNIYRGGRDNLENEIRESKTKQLKAESDREYQSELRDARKYYWQLVAAKHLLVELETSLKDNEQNISSAKRRTGAGVATNSDTVQFELEKTLIVQEIKKIKIEQDKLQNRLSVILALDDHKSLELADDFNHPPEPAQNNQAIDVKNSDLRVLEEDHRNQTLQKTRTGRWWTPSLDIYTAYRRPSFLESDTRALAKENEWVSGVQVSFSLGQGFEDTADKNSKELEAQSTALKISRLKRMTAATHHDLNHDLALVHELIHDADKDVEKAQTFLSLTKAEYRRGVKNGPDLQEAFSKLYAFKNRRTDLYRAFYEMQAELNYLIGSDI